MPKILFRYSAILIALVGCRGQIGDSPAGRVTPPAGGSGPVVGGSGGSGAPPSETATCNPAQKSFAPARLWQLTDEEYVNVIRDVLGITLTGEDARIANAGGAGRYTNYSEELSIDAQAAPNYQTAAFKVADLAEARMASLVGPAPTSAQLRAFITTKVARAWRRPLETTEVDSLLAIYTDALPDGA